MLLQLECNDRVTPSVIHDRTLQDCVVPFFIAEPLSYSHLYRVPATNDSLDVLVSYELFLKLRFFTSSHFPKAFTAGHSLVRCWPAL